jgi:tRNA dimethylallyltransferase
MNKDTVIIIVGATCVGKTALSLILAEQLNGEIVSADSRQIYKGMDIGTDKPSEEIRKKVKHHMIDIVYPDEYYSAGRYGKEAKEIIDRLISDGKFPIVVGGAGLYIRALTDGIFPELKKDYTIKKYLREKVGKEGINGLYSYLEKIDPESAVRLNPLDKQRIVRAVEVYEVLGKPLSELLKIESHPLNHKILFIGLERNRTELYHKIEKRIDGMIQKGLVEEVKILREKGYHRELDSMRALGYREVHQYLDNEFSLEEAIKLMKRKSRNYAKRQITWFKKIENIKWFHLSEDDKLENIADFVMKITD